MEICLVTTYKRPEHLFMCLDRILRAEPEMDVMVFPDRGTLHDEELKMLMAAFSVRKVNWAYVPDHDYHGNTYNTMEAFRFAANANIDTVYYIEDDVMIHPDFFKWHRAQHEMWPEIFATMAWIFNRHAPISDDAMFQPWYYAIGTCFKLEKLKLVAQHASPKYYADMQGYIESNFPLSKLNSPFGIQHFEQDGLIQRVLDLDHTQTISPGIAKCSHMGNFGYNRGWDPAIDFFGDAELFMQRVDRLDTFINDPYWRAEVFGRDIVEREIGKTLEPRTFNYRLSLPGGWATEFKSELSQDRLPRRIHSVTIGSDAHIERMEESKK